MLHQARILYCLFVLSARFVCFDKICYFYSIQMDKRESAREKVFAAISLFSLSHTAHTHTQPYHANLIANDEMIHLFILLLSIISFPLPSFYSLLKCFRFHSQWPFIYFLLNKTHPK